MDTFLANGKIQLTLLEGEYHRIIKENGNKTCYYLCVGVHQNNKILFQYIDVTGTPTNYIQDMANNLPEVAADYLAQVLDANDNILVRMTYYPGEVTGYEIYYDCDLSSDAIVDIINWMEEHNDFAAQEYSYTEIVDGTQRCIGSNEK